MSVLKKIQFILFGLSMLLLRLGLVRADAPWPIWVGYGKLPRGSLAGLEGAIAPSLHQVVLPGDP